jgi:hypothetical protein
LRSVTVARVRILRDSISGKRYRDFDALFAAARNDPMFAESSLAAEESGAGGASWAAFTLETR